VPVVPMSGSTRIITALLSAARCAVPGTPR
jgi:hypothetical protein